MNTLTPDVLLTAPVMDVPLSITLCVTDECPLRCRHCHIWTLEDPPDRMSRDEMVAVAHEIGKWAPQTRVTLTGGEPFLRKRELMAVVEALNASGVPWTVTTAGTLISNDAYDELLGGGEESDLIFSLDSPDRRTHDRYRGRPGTFASVTETLSGLARRREELGGGTSLRVNTLLAEWTITDVFRTIDLVRRCGADSILFQALIPTFAVAGTSDVCFKKERVRDRAKIQATFDELLRMAEEDARGSSGRLFFNQGVGGLIAIRDTMLGGDVPPVEPLVSSSALTRGRDLADAVEHTVCGSGRQNLMIKVDGGILLCHEMRDLFDGRTLGNIRDTSLQTAWSSDLAKEFRRTMDTCRLPCGSLACHTKRPSSEWRNVGIERLRSLFGALQEGEDRRYAARIIAILTKEAFHGDAIAATVRSLNESSQALVAQALSDLSTPPKDHEPGFIPR